MTNYDKIPEIRRKVWQNSAVSTKILKSIKAHIIATRRPSQIQSKSDRIEKRRLNRSKINILLRTSTFSRNEIHILFRVHYAYSYGFSLTPEKGWRETMSFETVSLYIVFAVYLIASDPWSYETIWKVPYHSSGLVVQAIKLKKDVMLRELMGKAATWHEQRHPYLYGWFKWKNI